MQNAKCLIWLADINENPSLVYRPGQSVSGSVVIRLSNPIDCKEISVYIRGSSRVRWTVTEAKHTPMDRRNPNPESSEATPPVTFEKKEIISEESYMDISMMLFSRAAAFSSLYSTGDHSYPFVFEIPQNTPSSYEGDIGNVRYLIEASLRDVTGAVITTKKYFSVKNDLDLNQLPPSVIGPFDSSDNVSVACCRLFNCCFGKVHVKVHLPKTGFVPGESVSFCSNIKNASKVDMKNIKFAIYQNVKFHAQGKTRCVSRKISDINAGDVKMGDERTINSSVFVESIPCSYLEGCNNIDIKYFFKVLGSGGLCFSLDKSLCELVIGAVPIQSHFGGQFCDPEVVTQEPPSYESLYSGSTCTRNRFAARPVSESRVIPSAPPSYDESEYYPCLE